MNKDKVRVWMEFIKNADLEKEYSPIRKKEIERFAEPFDPHLDKRTSEELIMDAEKYLEENPPIYEILEIINNAVIKDIGKINLLNPIFSLYNLKPLYSVQKSEQLITESIFQLLNNYEISSIPLTYSNYPLPNGMQENSSFKFEDLGSVDLIGSLMEFQKRQLLKIKSFDFIMADDKYLIIKTTLDCSNFNDLISNQTSSGVKPELDIKGLGYYSDGTIKYNGIEIKMPPRLIELCRLFMDNYDVLVNIDDIKEAIISADKRNKIPTDTISKYVSELDGILKEAMNTKRSFFNNTKKTGWKFKIEN